MLLCAPVPGPSRALRRKPPGLQQPNLLQSPQPPDLFHWRGGSRPQPFHRRNRRPGHPAGRELRVRRGPPCSHPQSRTRYGMELSNAVSGRSLDRGCAAGIHEPGCAWGFDLELIRIVAEPHVYASFCRLNAMRFSPSDACDKEAALIEFIGECDGALGLHIREPVIPSRVNSLLRPVLDFLHQGATPAIELVELARLAGMSRSQLIRAFRTVTGTTPHAWLLNQRVNQGRERIRAGESIAAVAYDLGFSDQAHWCLHRGRFRRHDGDETREWSVRSPATCRLRVPALSRDFVRSPRWGQCLGKHGRSKTRTATSGALDLSLVTCHRHAFPVRDSQPQKCIVLR